ncbi:7tm 7 domain containing protein, partial [Asbolus verrucosus]
MFALLQLVFYVGDFFAITPKSTGRRRSKLYSLWVLMFFVIGVTISTVYKKPEYMELVHIKFAVAIFMDLTLFVFNCTVVVIGIWKRKQWAILIKFLKMTPASHGSRLKLPYYTSFLVTHVIFWIVTIYDAYAWSDIMGTEFAKRYSVEIIQSYLLFLYQYLLYVIVKMLLLRYRHLVQNFMQRQLSLKKIEYNFCLLRVIVETFNDIFGWPFLLIIFYTSLQLLSYFDDSFKSGFLYDENEYDEMIISNVCFLIMTTGGTIILIWLCDLILQESEKILALAYKLRRFNNVEKAEVENFIATLVDNFPQFSAARFFLINRSIILNILNILFTCLIFMIQQEGYADLIHVRYAITIMMDLTLYLFNCTIIVVAVFWKRKQWYRLLRNLKMTESRNTDRSKVPYWTSFVVTHVIFWMITVYDTYAWVDIMGFEFFKQYSVEIFQSYFLFLYQFLLYVITKLVLLRYRKLVALLMPQFHYSAELRQSVSTTDNFLLSIKNFENKFCLLKEIVEVFNDVFGWPILLIIIYTGLQLLNYIDELSDRRFQESEFDEAVVSNVSFLLLTSTGTIMLFWICDLVLREVEKILTLSYRLRCRFTGVISKERREVQEFASVIHDNAPTFTAA